MKRPRKAVPLQVESIEFTTAPYDGPIAVEQRLQTIIEVAIDIGLKKGLFNNHKQIEAIRRKGGSNVTNKGNIRDRKATPAGENKAGHQEGE